MCKDYIKIIWNGQEWSFENIKVRKLNLATGNIRELETSVI